MVLSSTDCHRSERQRCRRCEGFEFLRSVPLFSIGDHSRLECIHYRSKLSLTSDGRAAGITRVADPTLQTIDALTWARSRVERFFPSGKPDPVYLLAYLMADVLELGRGTCVIRQCGDWWTIGSDVDWLRDSRYSEEELFRRVVPAPEHGEHSMRGEIIAAAFARSVWVAIDGTRKLIHGDDVPEEVWNATSGLHRVMVFRM
jgi:hypothetical protein